MTRFFALLVAVTLLPAHAHGFSLLCEDAEKTMVGWSKDDQSWKTQPYLKQIFLVRKAESEDRENWLMSGCGGAMVDLSNRIELPHTRLEQDCYVVEAKSGDSIYLSNSFLCVVEFSFDALSSMDCIGGRTTFSYAKLKEGRFIYSSTIPVHLSDVPSVLAGAGSCIVR